MAFWKRITISSSDEYLTHDSCNFHLNQGFEEVAYMKKVGKIFDRCYDLKWFQKEIGGH